MSLPSVMRALQQTSLNGPKDLRLITDAPLPVPGPGQILVRVSAAGINFADLSQAHGTFGGGPQPPYLAGFEAAGEVVALGEAVTGIARGAHVTGVAYGAFAEYVVFPTFTVVPVPQGWSDEQALGLVVNWPTALAALKYLGQLSKGQTVLIHSAAGGTGQAAVKMAKHFGAAVIATASPEKHETVRALGADNVLDSRKSDVLSEVMRLTGGVGADLVLECVGGATFARASPRCMIWQMALRPWQTLKTGPASGSWHCGPERAGDRVRRFPRKSIGDPSREVDFNKPVASGALCDPCKDLEFCTASNRFDPYRTFIVAFRALRCS
jgi:NADPH:quinone reductase-like Zn-dependent oxidoreductase